MSTVRSLGALIEVSWGVTNRAGGPCVRSAGGFQFVAERDLTSRHL